MYTAHPIPTNTRLTYLTVADIQHLTLAEFLDACINHLEVTDRGIYLHTQVVNGKFLIYCPSEQAFVELDLHNGAGGVGWMCLSKD